MRLTTPLPRTREGEMRLLTRRAGCALVAVIVVISYLNALAGAFVFDDRSLVLGNPTLRSAAFIARILTTNLWAFLGRSTNYYRPLPPLLLMLVSAIFGLRPMAFHVVSVILHASAACLVFGIARRLLRSKPSEEDPVWAAVLAGLLFGVHPVNTESVAWVSGLVDALGTFFSVLTLYTHIRAEESSAPWRWRVAAGCTLMLALLSKEPALAVLPILIALDLVGPPARRPGPRDILARWGPLVVVCAGYLVVRALVLGGLAPVRRGAAGSPADVIVLLSRYLEKLVFPVHLSVVPEIPRASALSSLDLIRAAVVLSTAAGAAAYLWWRGDRALRTGLLIVFLPLAPVLYAQLLTQPELLANRFAERHLYLSTFGWAVIVARVALSIARRSAALRLAVRLSAAALILLFAGATMARNRVWHDEISLWSDAVEKSPGVAEVHFKLGIALLEGADAAAGQRELQRGERIDPSFVRELYARALDDERAGELRRALAEIHVVTLALPDFAEAHFQDGLMLESVGDREAALEAYVETLHLDSRHVEAARRAARLLRASGRSADALRVLETAARNSPGDARLMNDMEETRPGTGSRGARAP